MAPGLARGFFVGGDLAQLSSGEIRATILLQLRPACHAAGIRAAVFVRGEGRGAGKHECERA
jgi:hypothetical protein